MSKKRFSHKTHKIITAAITAALAVAIAGDLFFYNKLSEIKNVTTSIVQEISAEKTGKNRSPELKDKYTEYDRKSAQLADMKQNIYDYTANIDKLQNTIDENEEQIQYETECKDSYVAKYKADTYEKLFKKYQELKG